MSTATATATATAAPPLAAWLRDQATAYRAHGLDPAGHAAWLARHLERLAALAEYTGARTGPVLADRTATLRRGRQP